MPTKNLKPCTYPGCPELIPRGTQYCEKHQAKAYSDYDKFERTSEEKARYQGKWERIRKAYLAKHPYCEVCFAAGVMKSADMVHHRRPLADGGDNSEGNLQAICYRCHAKAHPEKGANYRGGGRPRR